MRYQLPPLESLEPRRLLSAVQIADVLIIEGTSASDNIFINTRDAGVTLRVIVNGQRSYFTAAGINQIQAYGYRGQDDIEISNAIPINALITGDKGNDTLFGGAGNDSLYGNTGHDSILGGDGNDPILGLSGNDDLFGENGDDTILGGAGDDLIYGDAGNDDLSGQDDNDRILGGQGHAPIP